MIVIDASAMVEALLGRTDVHAAMVGHDIAVPHLLDVEVASALHHLMRSGQITQEAAAARITALSRADLARYPHDALLGSIWQLSHNLSPYDAAYVALSSALRVPLVTADRRLAASPGLPCEVVAV